MAAFILLVAILPVVVLLAAHEGILGRRAQLWVTELNETGKRERLERDLRDADEASAAAYLDARSAMNEAAGQEWRNLTEWRHD